MRRRNVTGVILDPKSGDAGSASLSVGKSLRTVQRARLFNDKHSSRDRPDNSTEKQEEVREKTDHPTRPSLRARHANNDVSFVMFILPGYLLSATRCRVDYR